MKQIPVFFHPEQNVRVNPSFSPSASKPALVMQDWLDNPKTASCIDVRTFEPVSRDLLYQVHDRNYVDGVLDCTIPNGFGTFSPAIAASLPYTVGSIVAAAKHVLTGHDEPRFKVAVSPTSGFHHARYRSCSGFCTFNGLMAAAVEVHRLGLAKRILILDGDAHYGNGTDDIIQQLGLDYVTNITAVKSYKTAEEAIKLFDIVNAHTICTRCPNKKYDLILYQAGADIHVNDPLGGLLTTAQMRTRDQTVLCGAITADVPVVVNLAGGYKRDKTGGIKPVLQLHRQTLLECIRQSN